MSSSETAASQIRGKLRAHQEPAAHPRTNVFSEAESSGLHGAPSVTTGASRPLPCKPAMVA